VYQIYLGNTTVMAVFHIFYSSEATGQRRPPHSFEKIILDEKVTNLI